MYLKFALRDAGIIAVAAALWWLLAERSAGVSMLADFSGFVVGVLFGVVAFVLHEWGHVVGAWFSGSTMTVNHNLRSPYIFSYDSSDNTLRQFVVMSIGGFVVTAVLVAAYYFYLPDDLLASRVARGGVLFLAFLGVVLEVPLLLFALLSKTVPEVAAVRVQASRDGASSARTGSRVPPLVAISQPSRLKR